VAAGRPHPPTAWDRAVREHGPKGITCRPCTRLPSGAKFKCRPPKSNRDDRANVCRICIAFGQLGGGFSSVGGEAVYNRTARRVARVRCRFQNRRTLNGWIRRGHTSHHRSKVTDATPCLAHAPACTSPSTHSLFFRSRANPAGSARFAARWAMPQAAAAAASLNGRRERNASARCLTGAAALSASRRSHRACGGGNELCGRLYGTKSRCLGDGRWWSSERKRGQMRVVEMEN